MELSITVALQVCIMAILIVVGYVLTKAKIINQTGARQMSDVLLMIVTPCVLIQSYQIDFEVNMAIGLGIAALLALGIHIVGIAVVPLLFRREQTNHYRIDRFAAIYSNCGFMAIPILGAVLGSEGVFYGSAYLAVFTVLSWTHGIFLYTGDKKSLSIRKILLNPGVIGIVIGLLLFFCRIRLPYVLSASVDYIAALNTPLAMLLLGVFLSDIQFRRALSNLSLYKVSAVRLLILPLVALIGFKLFHIDALIAAAVMIPAACPSANIAALFAARFDLDTGYASELVAINTLFSILTIPLIMAVNAMW